MILNSLNGRISKMDQFVHNMDFEITDHREKPDRGVFFWYLSIIGYTYIFIPFISVVYWGVLLIYDSYDDNRIT